jgi:hypothetical protein
MAPDIANTDRQTFDRGEGTRFPKNRTRTNRPRVERGNLQASLGGGSMTSYAPSCCGVPPSSTRRAPADGFFFIWSVDDVWEAERVAPGGLGASTSKLNAPEI